MASRKNNDSIIDGVIDRVTKLTEAGRKTAADWVENVSPDAANLIRPETTHKTAKAPVKRTIKVTGPKAAAATKSTAKKSPVKKAATAVKTTARKAASRSTHRSATR
jgi:hypothetical protein